MVRIFTLLALILALMAVAACRSNPPMAPVLNGWSTTTGKNSGYVVQPGDSLYSIAWAFDVDYRDLAAKNHLKSPYAVHSGQRLIMAAKPAAKPIAKSVVKPKYAVYRPSVK